MPEWGERVGGRSGFGFPENSSGLEGRELSFLTQLPPFSEAQFHHLKDRHTSPSSRGFDEDEMNHDVGAHAWDSGRPLTGVDVSSPIAL